jgi:hypothetical protein
MSAARHGRPAGERSVLGDWAGSARGPGGRGKDITTPGRDRGV